MPREKYFKGKGKEVMKKMEKEYGKKKGKQVFYGTANSKRPGSPKFGFGR